MKVKLLKLLRQKFNFKHNSHIWFVDYKFDSIDCDSKPHSNSWLKTNLTCEDMDNFINKHNDYIGLSKRQLKKLTSK